MDAALGAKKPVSVLARGFEGCRLDPCLLARAGLQQFDFKATALSPAHHHPQDHLGPVLSIGAASAGVDRYERVAGVVVTGEEALFLERRQPPLNVD